MELALMKVLPFVILKNMDIKSKNNYLIGCVL